MTRAIDTNVALRFLTGDDPVQTPLARAVVAKPFVLPATVLLEIEWVLRSWYKWPRVMIAKGLRLLIDLPNLQDVVPNATWVIDRYADGADFADVVHIASAIDASAFATFDQAIASHAGTASPLPIETLV